MQEPAEGPGGGHGLGEGLIYKEYYQILANIVQYIVKYYRFLTKTVISQKGALFFKKRKSACGRLRLGEAKGL